MTARVTKEKAPLPHIPPRIVSGIDALYFHINVNYVDYSLFYENILLNRVLEDDDTLSMLSYSYDKQYTIFQYSICLSEGISPSESDFKFCKIMFKNLNTADNLDSIKIQMNSSALQIFTIDKIKSKIENKLNEFGLTINDTKINRLDLNAYINGFSFDWLDFEYFNTLSRKSEKEFSTNNNKYDSGVLQTFYLGSRDSSSLMLRIYNKWAELSALKRSDINSSMLKDTLIDLKFKYKYSEPVDRDLPLWNIEFELKREQLRRFNINTLEDVTHLTNSLFKYLVTKSIKLLDRKKVLGDTNTNKIPIHTVWKQLEDEYIYNSSEILDIEKIKLPNYRRDRKWLQNRIREFLSDPLNLNDPVSLIAQKILHF